MKASAGFIFFMLFLAGLAFVNLRNMGDNKISPVLSHAEIAAVQWRPTHLGETPLPVDTSMFVLFGQDGKVSGNGGCNSFFGQYEMQEGALLIESLVSTRMACPEPANSFEISFLAALAQARTVVRAGDRLAFKDAGNVSVLRFSAATTSAED